VEQRGQLDPNSRVFETFGSYLFLKRLAAGGMAEVFLARPASQGGNGRVTVVKRILPHVANNPVFLKMFQTEIQVIMGFNNPHTVQLHDSGEFNGQPFIAMEYIEGKNLKELMAKVIDQKQQLPVPTVLSLIAQAASGLSYAHSFVNKVTGETVNAIHRDISPHNLILSYEGNLKVIDFGIAKAASSMAEQTRVGTIKGKTAYMSPEQVNGEALDARSDIFALGIVAWELLTLKRPFTKDGDSEVNILARIDNCDQHVVPPSQHNPDIPKEVDEIILKTLRKNPQERYTTASEFQTALRQAMLKLSPNYSYDDTGKIIRSLFSAEIIEERKELQLLNMQAQATLYSRNASTDKTMIVPTSDHSKMMSAPFRHLRSADEEDGSTHMDVRLTKIETMIKQKATARHYMMFAFYVFSLIALKLDNQYSIFNLIFHEQAAQADNAEYAMASTAAHPAARNPANSAAARNAAHSNKNVNKNKVAKVSRYDD
jgi:serine/threonine protein kinase